MSRVCVVLGDFRFRNNVTDEEKNRVIAELERATEVKIEWNRERERYEWVEKINYVYSGESNNIEKTINKNKDLLEYLVFGINYLSKSDEAFSFDSIGNGEVKHYKR